MTKKHHSFKLFEKLNSNDYFNSGREKNHRDVIVLSSQSKGLKYFNLLHEVTDFAEK